MKRVGIAGFEEQLLHFCVAFLIQTGQGTISSWHALKRPQRAAKQSLEEHSWLLNRNMGWGKLGFDPRVVIRSPAARFGH